MTSFNPYEIDDVARLAASIVGQRVVGMECEGTLTLTFENGTEFEISDPLGSLRPLHCNPDLGLDGKPWKPVEIDWDDEPREENQE